MSFRERDRRSLGGIVELTGPLRVGPALAAVPSRNARDGRNGMPTSGSPTTMARMVISRTTNASQLCAVSE